MSKLTIPFESLDPLTIGASGDETKVYREELELEVPDENLLAAIYPDEPQPLGNATEAARAALEAPSSGPSFSELLGSANRVAVIIDNQFRPTPASRLLPPVLDAIEAAGKPAVLCCANGKVFPMSDSDMGKTFPLAQATTAGFPAASIASKTAGRRRDCGVGRNWLSMTTATFVAPASSSEKRGPETGDSSAPRAASVASPTGSGSLG